MPPKNFLDFPHGPIKFPSNNSPLKINSLSQKIIDDNNYFHSTFQLLKK